MTTTKVNPIPAGMHTVVPHLVLSDAAKAIEFYKAAFGATEHGRAPGPDGKTIWHADIQIGDSHIFLADEAVSMGLKSPLGGSPSPITLQLNVADCDVIFERAVAAGATPKMPPMDMFWGDRYGQLTDPFGYTWAVSTRVKELTPEEMMAASIEAAKAYAQK